VSQRVKVCRPLNTVPQLTNAIAILSSRIQNRIQGFFTNPPGSVRIQDFEICNNTNEMENAKNRTEQQS